LAVTMHREISPQTDHQQTFAKRSARHFVKSAPPSHVGPPSESTHPGSPHLVPGSTSTCTPLP
jgi:hypothetical protein